jgi:hypothetical protein
MGQVDSFASRLLFDPDTCKSLSLAFDTAWQKLLLSGSALAYAGCRAYWHRMHPGASRTENAKKAPARQVLLKPVCATERPSEYAPCEACGRSCRIEPGAATFCNERCRSYVPLPPRKPDGQWFTVAGPVNVCVACRLAITPTKRPWRKDDKLYCSAECRRARQKADQRLEGAAS